MDGVLVDNRDAHIEAFAVICRKYGVPFSRERFMPSAPVHWLLRFRKAPISLTACTIMTVWIRTERSGTYISKRRWKWRIYTAVPNQNSP